MCSLNGTVCTEKAVQSGDKSIYFNHSVLGDFLFVGSKKQLLFNFQLNFCIEKWEKKWEGFQNILDSHLFLSVFSMAIPLFIPCPWSIPQGQLWTRFWVQSE